MKTAFKILPEFSPGKDYHLLVEAGRDGVSLVWYSNAPLKIEGVFIFQSQKNITDISLAEAIQKHLASENIPHYSSVKIFYNFKESLIVPDSFYTEANSKEMLDLVYGDLPGSRYFYEPVKEMQATNIYKVSSAVHDALTNRFFAASAMHSNSCILPVFSEGLYCVVYNNYIKTILYKNGRLQLIQLYDYNTPADVAYQLLNICTQHQLSPAEITLTLSGFIDQQSNLYEELYRYFLHIKMEEFPGNIEIPDEMRTYPDHFFSFLINLVKCAS